MSATTIITAMENSRKQPLRSTRTKPARAGAIQEEPDEEKEVMFLPGITAFTNIIDALPKEMIKETGLLREVEAKLHGPEQQLQAFVRSKQPEYIPEQEAQGNGPVSKYYEGAINTMASMLSSLDEKNHVIVNANENLNRMLKQLDGTWPLIEEEISLATRWGKEDNWAYVDKSADKQKQTTAERPSRRNHDAERAAAAVVESLTKGTKSSKRAAQDAMEAEEAQRKTGQNKRKPNEATAAGLGITNVIKRRKVEKPLPTATNGYPMEKSVSSAFRNPPGSPNSDAKRKGKNANGTGNGNRRRAGTTTSNVDSPTMASSPIVGTFALPGKGPALGASMARSASSRARNGPTSAPMQSTRPASAASTPLMNGITYPDEKPTISRTNSGLRGAFEQNNDEDNARSSSRTGIKREDTSSKQRPPSISTTSRNPGRASKTGTPIIGSFPDSRPRSGRNSTTTLTTALNDLLPPKRSHKKKEPASLQRQRSQQKSTNGGTRSRDEDESEDDGGEEGETGEAEQLYCYCNGPSHGEMVACDMPGCEKEWFHLECVGLSKPPSTKTKWYCPDCALKLPKMKQNGGAVPA